MKINWTNILLIVLILLLALQFFSKEEEVEVVHPITITIPEKSFEVKSVIEEYKSEPIIIREGEAASNVDSKWKILYEQAKDSLEKERLYLESIKINNYEKILLDNDTVKVKGFATTRGSLLDYAVDVTIKPFDFQYKPEVVETRPSLSVGLGVEGGIPTQPDTGFPMKGTLYVENKKGIGYSAGYDTQGRVWLGVRKNFKIK